jgi:tetratricopeptide (TPR) repeat protein
VLLAAAMLAAPSGAQDVESDYPSEPPGFEVPDTVNEEPSSGDTLFDQSDLGNVVQSAQSHYHAGRREMQAAEKLARKAQEAASEERRQEILARRAQTLERAAGEFVEAIGFDRALMEAYVALGETYRTLDEHARALQVHAAALAVDPESEANFEGWAGSLLALDRLGDAVAAYDSYSAARPERARHLLDGMRHWLEAKRQDPGAVPPEAIQRLAEWLAQHEVGS